MSYLRADDRSSRGRSKLGTRERSRSRSNVRAPSPPNSKPSGYAPPPPATAAASPAMPGSFDNGITSPSYEDRPPQGGAGESRLTSYPKATTGAIQYPPPPSAAPYPSDGWMNSNYLADLPPHERPGYVPPLARFPSYPAEDEDDLAYGDQHGSFPASRQPSYVGAPYPTQSQHPVQSDQPPAAAIYTAQDVTSASRSGSYSHQYAPPPEKFTYTDERQDLASAPSYTQSAQLQRQELPRNYSHERHTSYSQQNATYVDITPGANGRPRTSSNANPDRLYLSTEMQAPGLGQRMNRLSVSGERPAIGGSGDMPPPSPLLEAYHGTYQSLASPLALRPGYDDDDMSELEPLSPSLSRRSSDKNPKSKLKDKLSKDAEKRKEKKKITLYSDEAEEEAKQIAKALSHHKLDSDPIIDILPRLSHDQIWELRKEYKKQVKIQGKGINLPKHLRCKLTGNFGKAAYVTALGRWESEGYWANFWYQSHGSRRELLIESLMGRTNLEIRNIKDEFKDKRYSDSLTRCMEKELKMDKFRSAVMMVLEERRQEEIDVYPVEYRVRDVEMLHRALTAERGGESAMLEIIVRRSDAHLKEVLRLYEQMHGENFARAALRKSNNLVGEIIAHILNGVINKPARDAVLLNHAIKDIADRNKEDELRYELLISRLVRIHWDRMHLTKVKRAYQERFRRHMQQDIEEATKGDFREFMCELCETK
ncbi:Annexin [Teratosphaeria nubilosa]|uniref:Annexin n=1 Tax=Teratosphaeria nubilosa TaxID=161662 RepID=A0A6G1L2H5_9PEZI|nr:Annexin [Teratosphaeria nubilosa]